MSDTDDSFNFLISMCYTQLFNLLCEKADDVYGGRLPIHVRCLIDECANIGQIPKLEKLVATIRSREISACLVLQAQSQLKAIYKDNADTIIGNMDTSIFLGGKEPTTLKELAAVLGKETIDTYNTGESRGRETSHSLNYQKLGKELMSQDELAVMDGGKCILQLRGVRPFLSDKYDITKHPNFKYTADADDKNAFDIEAFLSARLKLKPNEVYIASWSQGKELKELRASLETINKTSGTLISDIERHYKEICKERGIDPHAKAEPETAPIEQSTGNLTYYVAECMEFPNLGEYHDNLSLEEAVRIYQEIPAERMNGIKGIGFELKDGSDYEGPFPILTGHTIDLDTIQAIDYYRDNPLVQKAVKELAAAMPEMEVLGADANQQEALFLINDTTYLHIQPCDSGWDYTLYDAASMKELDGGQLDMPELSCMKVVLQICDDNDLDSTSLRRAPLSMVETLQEAAYEQMQAEASQMTASSQLPEAQEQALDEYPMPDEQVSTPDMQEYGYTYDGMLPVTRERALELDAAGLTVYVLHEDNTESMVFDPQEIMDHGGLFGVDHEEWEKSPQFHEKVMERQEHQQEREQAFLSQNRDCFAIYQVSRDDPQNVRFMNLDWLKSHNISIDRSNYDLIYTAPLRESGTVPEQLEKLYQQFNLEKPVDFHSPSMSVSDIVAIKQDGKVSCHYCDSVGFTQIPGFLPENPLKNAEMMLEDDYGMIDGIINNGAKEPTVAELEQQARSGQPISLMDL